MLLQSARLSINGEAIEIIPGKTHFSDALYAQLSNVESINQGQTVQLEIHPKEPVRLDYVRLQFSHPFESKQSIFCNGYQSWTESREYQTDEKILGLRKIAHRLMLPYGDYGFYDYPEQPGKFHSWTYGYIRQAQDQLLLVGSLNEKTGFTRFEFDVQEHQIIAEKDCAGQWLAHSFPALSLFWATGTDDACFDNWFKTLDIQPRTQQPAIGWTSWYNYYTNISETIILDNLKAFQDNDRTIDYFQIDDGYQTAVGDWLSIKPDFPNGMAPIAQAIHDADVQAGIWLAPFVCEKESALFKNQPDWVLKDANGHPVKAGYTPLWSGHFYALDFYQPEVQKYLTDVFTTVFERWNYDLVKLDFLYAVALQPPRNKNRGQVMYEAMEFLERCCKGKKILACGVPLGSTFGMVDYCRIGADIHLKWEHRLLAFLRNRERVSTKLALTNSLSRRHLDGRAFMNDPDVFILRKQKHKLPYELQQTIALINAISGSLVFTSDYAGDYDPEQWSEWEAVKHWQAGKIEWVEQQGPLYRVYFSKDQMNYCLLANLNPKQSIITQPVSLELAAFESLIVKIKKG
ncbi:MAG: glycoside hydrolase family 36 protein [Bacteroidota bacterium]